MPEWLKEFLDTQLVLFIVGAIMIGGFLWKTYKLFRPAVKGITDITSDLRGEPERLDAAGQMIEPARPGALARISATEEAQAETQRIQAQMQETLARLVPLVERIHHETTPNHGGSMNDALKRIEARQEASDKKLDEHIVIAKQDGKRLEALERDHRTN